MRGSIKLGYSELDGTTILNVSSKHGMVWPKLSPLPRTFISSNYKPCKTTHKCISRSYISYEEEDSILPSSLHLDLDEVIDGLSCLLSCSGGEYYGAFWQEDAV